MIQDQEQQHLNSFQENNNIFVPQSKSRNQSKRKRDKLTHQSNEADNESPIFQSLKQMKYQCDLIKKQQEDFNQKLSLFIQCAEATSTKVIKTREKYLSKCESQNSEANETIHNQQKYFNVEEFDSKQLPIITRFQINLNLYMSFFKTFQEKAVTEILPKQDLEIKVTDYPIIHQQKYEKLVSQIDNDIFVFKCFTNNFFDILQLENEDESKGIVRSKIITRLDFEPEVVFKIENLLLINDLLISLDDMTTVQQLNKTPTSCLLMKNGLVYFSLLNYRVQTYKLEQGKLNLIKEEQLFKNNGNNYQQYANFQHNPFAHQSDAFNRQFFICLKRNKRLIKVTIGGDNLMQSTRDKLADRCDGVQFIDAKHLLSLNELECVLISFEPIQQLMRIAMRGQIFEVPSNFDMILKPVLVTQKTGESEFRVADIMHHGYKGVLKREKKTTVEYAGYIISWQNSDLPNQYEVNQRFFVLLDQWGVLSLQTITVE